MKQKTKSNSNASGLRRPQNRRHLSTHETVRALMERGAVEDQVALALDRDKNLLRKRHIEALRNGRETRRQQIAAAERERLTKKEAELRAVCLAGFNTKWQRPDGTNPLQQNKTLAEAMEEFERLRARMS
jgi:hypothetical protein